MGSPPWKRPPSKLTMWPRSGRSARRSSATYLCMACMCARRVVRLCSVRAAAAVVCRRIEREGEGELRLVCVHRQLRLLRLRPRLISYEESIMHTHLLRAREGLE
eukprot:scaffold57668_cov63-Phaeocystis_antarctica.AAC.1